MDKKNERPPYGMITILMIGAFVAFLNNTLLNIALPSIMNDLRVEPPTVQWLTTGFMLVNGVLVPATAFFIQKYSVRRLFLTAISLFIGGTVIAGFAGEFSVLLIARMVQAAGTAIMMPLLMNVILVSFPIEKRGLAMGVLGFILMFAPAIGPTLSGWIVEHYSWRALFHFISPIATAIFIIGIFLLNDEKKTVAMHLDVQSLLLSAFGFGGVLFGFSSAGEAGWKNPVVLVPLFIGVTSLFLFIRRQSRLEQPMLNFHVYQYPMFALSSVITMVVNMSFFSGMLLLPIYVQTIRGISPLDAGLMLLPGAVVNAFMSPITGRLFDKYGGKILAMIGLGIVTVTTYFFSKLTFETGYGYLTVLNAIRMFGLSMVMMPVSTNGLNELPRSLYPHGTAMNNTLNQVSAAIGTGLMITVMSLRQDHYYNEMIRLAGESARANSGEFMMKAMMEGINDAFLLASFLALIAFALSFFIKRAKPDEDIYGKMDMKKNEINSSLAVEN